MFSAGICSNCIGCFAFGSCNDYDPSGGLGPTNPTNCAQLGGIVCSDIPGLELFVQLYFMLHIVKISCQM